MENNKAMIPQETFQIMDRLDDELIEQELKGHLRDLSLLMGVG